MPEIKRLKDKHTHLWPQYAHPNEASQTYYNTTKWHELRMTYRMEHPLCEQCLEKGIIRPAEDIHHKIPFLRGNTDAERWRLFLDYGNLQALCKECHEKMHNK